MKFCVDVLAPSWCTGFFIIIIKVVDLLSTFRTGTIKLSQSAIIRLNVDNKSTNSSEQESSASRQKQTDRQKLPFHLGVCRRRASRINAKFMGTTELLRDKNRAMDWTCTLEHGEH